MSKLPFLASVFWKVLAVVAILIVLVFWICIKFTEYERTTTDTVGATITGIIGSYLVHLWLLPAEYLPHAEDYDEEYDEGDIDEEDEDAREES
jgi:hypothetical protein